jgi:hypothetical protein
MDNWCIPAQGNSTITATKNLTSRRLQLMEIPAIKYEYQIKADGWQVAKTTNSLNIIKYGKMANEIKTEIINKYTKVCTDTHCYSCNGRN